MFPIIISQWAFPVFSCLRDCRSCYIFLEDVLWHTRFTIEAFICREIRIPFYTLHYINSRMFHKCWISNFKWPILRTSYRFNLTSQSPDNAHPVNLNIYIDSLVHYSWGVVDFNPFQSFLINYFNFYFRWLPMFLRITLRSIIN